MRGQKKTKTQITHALHDDNWYTRLTAVLETEQLGAEAAITLLGQALSDQDTTEEKSLPILYNPDAIELTVPFSQLRGIIVYAESYDFHLLERFLTYAVNYIGQTHLKQLVYVSIYGNLEQLHPNLQNALRHLCKRQNHSSALW